MSENPKKEDNQGKETSKGLTPSKVSPITKTPKDSSPELVMDGTAVVEFSETDNIHYSSQIITDIRSSFDIQKIQSLKGNKTEFLLESENQIKKLWHGIEALTFHNTMYVVLFLISIGQILDEIKQVLSRKDYIIWRNKAFGPKHDRYLQQAVQLFKIGIFAKKYAAIGKDRLLILDRLKKKHDLENSEEIISKNPPPEELIESLPEDKFLQQHNFPDMTDDVDGKLLKEHVDAIITHERFQEVGIDYMSFDQAFLIAAFNRQYISIQAAKRIKTRLDKEETEQGKKDLLDIYILNKLVFPSEGRTHSTPLDAINKTLGDFVDYCQKVDLNDQAWINDQKLKLHEATLLDANKNIKLLARKFDIRLSKRK